MLGGDGNGWNWLSYFKREVVSEEGEELSREGGYGAFFITRTARRIRSKCWTDLNSISGVKNKGQGNTRVPESSQGSTENDCSW